jgi:hypothetical protein
MAYHINFSALGLSYLKKRLKGVEPIPSHLPLLDGLDAKIAALKKTGISTLEDLSSALRGAKGPATLSGTSGIEADWLVLLRRAIEGFRPKPQPLADFPGIDSNTLHALAALGIKDSAALYEATITVKDRSTLAKKTGIAPAAIAELARLCDLCRIQWVNSTYSRLILEAGYESPAKVAGAEPDRLRDEVAAANAKLSLSKTDIGLKDSARLVALAGFLEEEAERHR